MAQENSHEQRDRVRERFTRTAEVFSSFVLTSRTADAERLVEMAAPRDGECVLDVACGPGTFALQFAPRVQTAVGLDVTPAILAQARAAAVAAGAENLSFVLGDGLSLPFAAGTFDIVSCGYSLHHMSDAAAALREFARAVRRGGRVAVADVVVAPPGSFAVNNAVEQARDSSHVRTLLPEEFPSVVEAAGLRVRECRTIVSPRSFKFWMSVGGWKPGDETYEATRRLMAQSIEGDTSGFHPVLAEDDSGDIHFQQTTQYIVAEKP